MKKYLLILLILLIVGVSVFALSTKQDRVSEQKSIASTKKLKLEIPKGTWEHIFFEAISERAGQSQLLNLRKSALPNGDFEVRIWEGFGVIALQGYVLSKKQGKWEAFHLPPLVPKEALEYVETDETLSAREKQQRLKELKHLLLTQKRTIPLKTPKSGWKKCWSRLEKEGILILPDSSQLKGEILVTDGTSYVVEINKDRVYRTYMYGNPAYQMWKEAKQMLKIAHIFKEEFNIKYPYE